MKRCSDRHGDVGLGRARVTVGVGLGASLEGENQIWLGKKILLASQLIIELVVILGIRLGSETPCPHQQTGEYLGWNSKVI